MFMKNWISPAIPILLCETDRTIKCNEHFSDFNIDVITTYSGFRNLHPSNCDHR